MQYLGVHAQEVVLHRLIPNVEPPPRWISHFTMASPPFLNILVNYKGLSLLAATFSLVCPPVAAQTIVTSQQEDQSAVPHDAKSRLTE